MPRSAIKLTVTSDQSEEEGVLEVQAAVEALRRAREALEVVAASRRRQRGNRLYWLELKADCAAFARVMYTLEDNLADQVS